MTPRDPRLAASDQRRPDRVPVDAIDLENVPQIAEFLPIAPASVRAPPGKTPATALATVRRPSRPRTCEAMAIASGPAGCVSSPVVPRDSLHRMGVETYARWH